MKKQKLKEISEEDLIKIFNRIKEVEKYSNSFIRFLSEYMLTITTISKILNGKTKPKIYTLGLICNALSIPLTYEFKEFKEKLFIPEKFIELY